MFVTPQSQLVSPFGTELNDYQQLTDLANRTPEYLCWVILRLGPKRLTVYFQALWVSEYSFCEAYCMDSSSLLGIGPQNGECPFGFTLKPQKRRALHMVVTCLAVTICHGPLKIGDSPHCFRVSLPPLMNVFDARYASEIGALRGASADGLRGVLRSWCDETVALRQGLPLAPDSRSCLLAPLPKLAGARMKMRAKPDQAGTHPFVLKCPALLQIRKVVAPS